MFPPMTARRTRFDLDLVLLVSWCNLAAAQELIVDQHCDLGLPQFFRNSAENLGPPWGQEFNPTLPFLRYADLFVDPGGGTITFLVNIRRATVDGQIVGTSSAVSVTGSSTAVAHAEFPVDVVLIPGQSYVLEPVPLAGTVLTIGFFDASGPTNCASGRFILSGTPMNGLELWFREGVIAAPPLVSVAMTSSNNLVLSWPDSSVKFVLQQRANLDHDTWLDLTNAPMLLSNRDQVHLPLNSGNQFFRLFHR